MYAKFVSLTLPFSWTFVSFIEYVSDNRACKKGISSMKRARKQDDKTTDKNGL